MEKLLVTSNFSFSHNVFYGYISLVRQNAVLCGNGVKMVPDYGTWVNVCVVNEAKNMKKRELTLTSQLFQVASDNL